MKGQPLTIGFYVSVHFRSGKVGVGRLFDIGVRSIMISDADMVYDPTLREFGLPVSDTERFDSMHIPFTSVEYIIQHRDRPELKNIKG